MRRNRIKLSAVNIKLASICQAVDYVADNLNKDSRATLDMLTNDLETLKTLNPYLGSEIDKVLRKINSLTIIF